MTRGLAEQARAADCLQRPLRSRFRQRLTRSVGLLGAAWLSGVAQGKSRPWPPVPGPTSGAVRGSGRAVSPVPTADPVRAGGGGAGTIQWAGPSWWPQAPAAVWLRG